jgi:hypothetical protein
VIAFLFDPYPFLPRFAIFLYKNQEYILNNLFCYFEMGGLNMIDIESYFASLRASWVITFVSGEMDNLKLIPYKYFRQFGKNWLIFSMNIDYKLFSNLYKM